MNFPASKVKINYARHARLFRIVRQKSRASKRGGKEKCCAESKALLCILSFG